MYLSASLMSCGGIHFRGWYHAKEGGGHIQGLQVSCPNLHLDIHGLTSGDLAQLVAELSREQRLMEDAERAAAGGPDPMDEDQCDLGAPLPTQFSDCD